MPCQWVRCPVSQVQNQVTHHLWSNLSLVSPNRFNIVCFEKKIVVFWSKSLIFGKITIFHARNRALDRAHDRWRHLGTPLCSSSRDERAPSTRTLLGDTTIAAVTSVETHSQKRLPYKQEHDPTVDIQPSTGVRALRHH